MMNQFLKNHFTIFYYFLNFGQVNNNYNVFDFVSDFDLTLIKVEQLGFDFNERSS